MKLKKIPYITLWIKNFDQAVNFYKDVLGLEIEYQDKNFVQFLTWGTKLYIHRTDSTQDLRRENVEIHFEVKDVDETYNELKNRGVVFEQKPVNMPWGRTTSFRDPESYVIELVGPHKKSEPVVQHSTQA